MDDEVMVRTVASVRSWKLRLADQFMSISLKTYGARSLRYDHVIIFNFFIRLTTLIMPKPGT